MPYRGNAPAMTDLIAGRIQLVSSSIGQFRPAMDAGKIRLLLTATKNRLPYLPDLPTSAEAGLPGYIMSVWIGVVAPAGTPAPVLDRIHALTQDMLKDEAAQKAMAGRGPRRHGDEPARVRRLREGGVCAMGEDREGRRRGEAVAAHQFGSIRAAFTATPIASTSLRKNAAVSAAVRLSGI